MGLLDGDLANEIYEGFKGELLTGIFRQAVPTVSGGLDRYGDDAAPDVPVDTDCEGWTEFYSAAFAARSGIPDTDVQVNIFSASMPGITPTPDDIVRLDRAGVSTWYQVRKKATDPAQAVWQLQSFEIPEPA